MGTDNFFAGLFEAILALVLELIRAQFAPFFTLIELFQQFTM